MTRLPHALIALGLTAVGTVAVEPASATQTKRLSASGLLSAMNQARAANGVPPLTRSAVLTRPARRHSSHLAATGALTHTGADGKPFYTRLYGAGYPRTKAVAENLAMTGGCSSDMAGTIVEMWLKSPKHRRNLLSRRYSKIGVGVVADAACERTAFTADFGG